MEAAIDACNRTEADLIAITGDIIGGGGGASPALELLSGLRRDLPRFACLGNHDHVHGQIPLDTLCAGTEKLGIVLLRNDAVSLDLPSGRIWVIGLDDGYSLRDDIDLAQSGLSDRDYPRLLLSHYPDLADRLRPGQFQLCLSGHSHAGQVRVPVLDRLMYNAHARTRFASGLYWVNGNPVHVSPGLGMSGVPLRFRNWPELTLLTTTQREQPVGRQPSGVSDVMRLNPREDKLDGAVKDEERESMVHAS